MGLVGQRMCWSSGAQRWTMVCELLVTSAQPEKCKGREQRLETSWQSDVGIRSHCVIRGLVSLNGRWTVSVSLNLSAEFHVS